MTDDAPSLDDRMADSTSPGDDEESGSHQTLAPDTGQNSDRPLPYQSSAQRYAVVLATILAGGAALYLGGLYAIAGVIIIASGISLMTVYGVTTDSDEASFTILGVLCVLIGTNLLGVPLFPWLPP